MFKVSPVISLNFSYSYQKPGINNVLAYNKTLGIDRLIPSRHIFCP